jgi:DNA-binding PadR family transcriptional regulator
MSSEKILNGTAAAVLAYLESGPQSGWDVARGLQAVVGDFWNVTPSQVYRELRSLAEGGFVVAGNPGPRDRRPYTITNSGRAARREWLGQKTERDVVRIPLLLRLFLLFATGEHDDASLAAMVRKYRLEHTQQLELYRSKHDELVAARVPEAHLVSYGIHHEEGILAWLDELPWQ